MIKLSNRVAIIPYLIEELHYMLAILMCVVMIADEPHHHSLPATLVTREHLFLLLLYAVSTDLLPNLRAESREAEAQRVSNEADILLEILRVHLLQKQEVFTHFMCEIDMLVVKLQITLILHIPLPNSHPPAKLDHFLEPPKQIKIILTEMCELEAILDQISIEKGRLAIKGHEETNEARCLEIAILTLYDDLQRFDCLSDILVLTLLSLLHSWLNLDLMRLLRLLLS